MYAPNAGHYSERVLENDASSAAMHFVIFMCDTSLNFFRVVSLFSAVASKPGDAITWPQRYMITVKQVPSQCQCCNNILPAANLNCIFMSSINAQQRHINTSRPFAVCKQPSVDLPVRHDTVSF